MPLFQELLHGLTHVFLPRLCEGCQTPLLQQEEILCLSCFQHLPRTDWHLIDDNEAAMRFAGRVPYEQVTALAVFTPDGLLQHLLHRLKYKDQQAIGIFFGKQLGYALLESSWLQQVDVLIPVPLHPKKEAKRGYNQSALIAEGVATVTGKKHLPKALHRVKHTESQTQKSREERVANVADAFHIPDPRALTGRHVLLLDDVLTTGATIEAVAKTLLQVPQLKLSIATVGIATG